MHTNHRQPFEFINASANKASSKKIWSYSHRGCSCDQRWQDKIGRYSMVIIILCCRSFCLNADGLSLSRPETVSGHGPVMKSQKPPDVRDNPCGLLISASLCGFPTLRSISLLCHCWRGLSMSYYCSRIRQRPLPIQQNKIQVQLWSGQVAGSPKVWMLERQGLRRMIHSLLPQVSEY